MNIYRVYYKIPAYMWIEVEADSEDEAITRADAAPELRDGGEWETDWDAEPELAFTVQME